MNAKELAQRFGFSTREFQNADGSVDPSKVAVRGAYYSDFLGRLQIFCALASIQPLAIERGETFGWAFFDRAAFEAVAVTLPTLPEVSESAKRKEAMAAKPHLSAVPDFTEEDEDADEDDSTGDFEEPDEEQDEVDPLGGFGK